MGMDVRQGIIRLRPAVWHGRTTRNCWVCGRDNDFPSKQNTRSGGRRTVRGVVSCQGSDACRRMESRDGKSNRAILAAALARLQNCRSKTGKWLPTVALVGPFSRSVKLPAVGQRARDNQGFDASTWRCGGSACGGNDLAPAEHPGFAPTYEVLRTYVVSFGLTRPGVVVGMDV
jgi:hypothetical protein